MFGMFKRMAPIAPKSNGFMKRLLFIQTEQTPNIDAMKFKPGKQILDSPNSTHEFLNAREAMKSNLASSLFRIDGVSSVFFGPDYITITKQPETNWQILKPGNWLLIYRYLWCNHGLFIDRKACD
jgi:hypothetical protein